MRLVTPTLFEVPGWEKIQFFKKAFEIYGFDKDSVSLTFKEVQHPISVGNGRIFNAISGKSTKTYDETFLVNEFTAEKNI